MKIPFVFISALFLATVALFSCTRESLNNKGGGEEGGKGVTSPHFFTNILKVKGLALQTYDDGGKGERPSLLVTLSGDMYTQKSEATAAEFEKLANAMGDVAKKEGYVHATPVDNQTTASPITEVLVKTLTDYDGAHAQGASLKDIIRIEYQSFDHVFDKTLKPTKFGSADHAMYSIAPEMAFTPIKYPALLAGVYTGNEYAGGSVMRIEFTQPPSTPSQQIRVTLRFENGLELSKEIAVHIKK